MMRHVIGNGGNLQASLITGVVDTYALLPAANLNADTLWFVRNSDRAFFPKYPRGFYYSNGTAWELTPIKVKWSEDAGSLLNWIDWSVWFTSGSDVSIGDRVIYNNIMYQNKTGTQTATAPDTDSTNWELAGVMRENTQSELYLNGDSETEGSRRFALSDTTGFAEIEKLVSGIWQPASLQTGSGSLWVGMRVGIAAAGHHIMTEDIDGHFHFHGHSKFDGEVSLSDARILDAYAHETRTVLQPDNSGTVTASTWGFTYANTRHNLLNGLYFLTDTTAPTTPMRFRIWEGSDDTGTLNFDQKYPASEFPVSTEIRLTTVGYLEFIKGQTYYARWDCDTDFSFKLNAALTLPWLADDVSRVHEDDLLQTTEWVSDDTFAVGQLSVQDKQLYKCNTAGVQSGTFASNIALWDNIATTDNLWKKSGTELSPKTTGDSISIYEGANPICKLWDGDGNDAGTLSLFTGTTQYVHFSADEDSWITGGNFGIGDDDPTSDLHVRCNYAIPATTVGITLEQAGAGDAILHYYLTGGQRIDAGIDNSTTNDDFCIGSGNFGVKYLSIDTSTNTVYVSNEAINSSTTTGKALSVEANSLTSGAGLYVGSSSSGLNDKLVELSISDAGATGDVLAIDNNGLGQAIDITSNNTENDTIAVTCDNLTAGDAFSINSASSSDASRDFIKIRHTGTGVNTNGININLGGSNGTLFAGSSSNTTQPGLRLDCNDLTYGAVAHFASLSADTNIRKLVHIQNANALSTGTTGLVIDQASTGDALSTNGNISAGSYDGVLNDGVTGTTQSADDNSTKIATTAYVDSAVSEEDIWDRSGTDVFLKNIGDDVGIGTTDPTAKLDVRGNLRIGDWISPDVYMVGVPASGGDFNIGQTSGSGKIKFVSNANADLITVQNDGDMGIGNNTPAVKLHVDTNSANTVAIQRLENTAGNFDIFRSDATPESSITGSMGDLAVDSTNGNTYTKHSGNATNTGWSQLQTNPSGTYDILTAADLEALATGSIITVSSDLMLNIKAPISSNVVYVMQAGATLGITYSLGGSYTYTGSSNQFSGVGGSLKIRNGSMTASGSSATLFSNSFTSPFEVINIQGTNFTGYSLGSLTGRASLIFDGSAIIDYRDTLTVEGHSLFRFTGIGGYSATVFPAKPIVHIKRGYGGTAINIFDSGALSIFGSAMVRIDPGIGNDSKTIINGVIMNLGDLFDTSGTTGTFTAVADASYSGITIDNVSDVSGNARFNYTTEALYVGQEVVVSNFLTYTAYNKTGIVSAVSSGSWFELESTPYIGSENGTGEFGVNSVTLTDTATTLSDGDTIHLDTALSTLYDGGTNVYNKQTNSVQVNKTWVGTTTGIWSAKGLDQDSCHVNAHDNEGTPDSVDIASGFTSGNTDATSTSTGSYLPLDLGTISVGQGNSRFKLIDTTTGEYIYTGMEAINCTMHATISASKSGSSRIYNFKFVKTGGTGAAFDNVIASRDITSRIGSLTLTTSATLDPNDTFRVEVEAEENGNDITVTNFSMVVE